MEGILPGICGLLIVFGIPFGMSQMGAVKLLIGVVAVQLLVAAVWDRMIEGISVDPWRLLGIGLAIAGAAIVATRS